MTELRPRELAVLEQAARGLSSRESAAETSHSEATVKYHRASIQRKLGARNICHAVHLAHRQGLLLDDDEREQVLLHAAKAVLDRRRLAHA